jgi:isopenicillin N synthase-like dioxygenase
MTEAVKEIGAGTSVPDIDFAGYTTGGPAARSYTAAQIRQAFEEFGFLYLRNHGVPPAIVDETFAQSRAFAALPVEAKMRTKGYTPLGYIGSDPTKPADIKSPFRVLPADEHAPDYWPAELPGMRDAALAFHSTASAVCRQLMAAVALALGLPEDYFDASHTPQSGAAHLHHYPPITGSVRPGQARAGAHTDYGTIALLFHDGNAGGWRFSGLTAIG